MDSSQSHAIVAAIAGIAVLYGVYTTYRLCTGGCKKAGRCNTQVRLNDPKIVHSFDIEDLDDKNVYCRCWKSKLFPLCDGSHNKHNETTGDNVGPLIIKKKTN